ncbi:MAG: hypothetical protein IPJ88_18825 [Myxococcales bacterium]|nr:MAG: hypothetical protein IPJ88_18825 [Myxococcales bacterium]
MNVVVKQLLKLISAVFRKNSGAFVAFMTGHPEKTTSRMRLLMARGEVKFKYLLASGLLFAVLVPSSGCGEKKEPTKAKPEKETQRVDSRPAPMARPVPLWKDAKQEKKVDAAKAAAEGYVLLDLGEDWTPYIFESIPEHEPAAYRKTYLALARGQFPDNHHGERAKDDEYLELYGIMPTLSLLRERFEAMAKKECISEIDLSAFQNFDGFVAYRRELATKQKAQAFLALERRVQQLMKNKAVASPEELDVSELDTRDASYLKNYLNQAPRVSAVRAAQKRMECEGYFQGLGKYLPGVLDWRTHEALARFERRHRVYGWGYIGHDTLEKLREPTLELERRAVVRVLSERAMHSAGVIEDGSTSTKLDGSPRTFKGKDGKTHPIPNFEASLSKHVVKAFGLQTPEATLSWLKKLGAIEAEHTVAIPGPSRPEYYDGDMKLSVEIDRGDVWYDFPFDEEGNERGQPVQRRPRLTLFTKYNGQKIPLVRIGTTVGGWRSDFENGHVLWRYKGSPTGPRVWKKIVAAPVWLPPESTPPKSLLTRSKKRGVKYEINYHEMGPSYASAYGLVAAYHEKYQKFDDGTIAVGGDEGIRTHGSVDYMSVARRNSHGCHRLHNHMAVRLMSFVLAHRPHIRIGQKRVFLDRELEVDDKTYELALREGGYEFELKEPIPVMVHEGRVRGKIKTPIEHALPKYDETIGAYVMPGQGAVKISPYGKLIDIPLPTDGGLPPPGFVKDEIQVPDIGMVPMPSSMPAAKH